MRRVVFRADASTTIGIGHVMRCLTLAASLRERRVDALFVCRANAGHLCNLIEERGFDAHRLPRSDDPPGDDDAAQTAAAIESLSQRPDWLIVDHYLIDDRWHHALRGSCERIMVIDDLADRAYDCDLLLDQNIVPDMHGRYAGKVPAGCATLLGPSYALIQAGYSELRDRVAVRAGPIRRILISVGGADPHDLTGRALSAVLSLSRADIQVDVVLGVASPNADSLRRLAAGRDNIRLHHNLPTLAPLMADADLAVGAGGATNWERLCLGLPTLVVTVADNQRPIAQELDRRGLIRWLGDDTTVDGPALARSLEELIEQGLDEAWSSKCLATVDGKGADRVTVALTAGPTTPLRVRRAGGDDEGLLLEWANDPTTRRNALSPGPITAATHRDWFRSRLDDIDRCRLYIVETTDAVAVGQVRFQRQDGEWEVHYSLAPLFRGRGLGRHLLHAALTALRAEMGPVVIFGQVRAGNHASRSVFESLGFDTRPDADAGRVVYQRQW